MADELQVFAKFAGHYPTRFVKTESRNPHEPDIYCESEDGSQFAFELVEVIDNHYARAISQMFALKNKFEQSFESLPAAKRDRLQKALSNASIFVTYHDKLNLRQKRAAIPHIFEFLQQLEPNDLEDFETSMNSSLRLVVQRIRVARGSFSGPMWTVTTVGLLSEPTIRILQDKFSKSYNTCSPRIELIGFFNFQPTPFVLPISDIENFIKDNISSSPFAAVWLYSSGEDNVITCVRNETSALQMEHGGNASMNTDAS